jgi:hypothetical protein
MIVSPPRAAVKAVLNVVNVFTVVLTANDAFANKQNKITKVDFKIFFIFIF